MALRHGVHPRTRLVEEDDEWLADQRDRDAELALVAAAQIACALVLEGEQGELGHTRLTYRVEIGLLDALDAAKHLEVLDHRYEWQERVCLRAVPQELAHLVLRVQDIEPAELCRAARRKDVGG